MPRTWTRTANIVAPFLVAILVVLVIMAWRSSIDGERNEATRIGGDEVGEPSHRVTYEIWGTGTANEDVRIQYMLGDGSGGEATAPGVAPFWKETVTTERGVYLTSLSATGNSSDLAFTLTCRVTVDGVEVLKDTGSGFCVGQFDFKDLAKAQARASARPSVATTTPVAKPPAAPTACTYVTAAETTEIVSRAAGVVKPVLSVGGAKDKCAHVIDANASTVSFEFVRGGASDGPQLGERVRSIKERAYWTGYGENMGTLRVRRPGGDEFVVDVFFMALQADAERIAIDMYKAARPRLP
jgi:hypothetical protein